MPPALEIQTKNQVIKEWLPGFTRDEISSKNEIGEGTVSNILNEWKKRIDSKDYDSIRELSVSLKSEGMAFNNLASIVRLNNQKIGRRF
jgi:hypothetical protein